MNTQKASKGEQMAPETRLDSEGVAPRKRQRARGATKTRTPGAKASNNGHDEIAVLAVIKTAKKPRRRYHHIAVGEVREVRNGFLQKWGEIEEEDRWGNLCKRHVRLRDEDGFPTAVWVETGRRLVDNRLDVYFPVEKSPEPPKAVWLENGKIHWSFGDGFIWWTDKSGATHHRGTPNTPKGTQPNSPSRIEWFRPAPLGHPNREAFVAKRTEWLAGLKSAPSEVVQPEPEPVPELAEQWFVVSLPEVAMQNRYWNDENHKWGDDEKPPPDAREHFPEGWCCKLVQPQPSGFVLSGHGWVRWDPNVAYVQFPVHYWTWGEDGKPFRRTDKIGRGKGDFRVECGMKIPRWLLKAVKPTEARPIYDWLVAEYKRAVKEAKEASR